MVQYRLQYMEKILLELDRETLARLEQIAPSRSRKRSEFLRLAIWKAIWDLEEQRTAAAYSQQPDSAAAYVDPRVWEPSPAGKRKARQKR